MDVTIKNLTKIFKPNVYALKKCTFDIKSGEFLVIMGASGSGKSTLLKVLAGAENPTVGEIYFDGISAKNIPTKQKSVSLVFQEYVLYPTKTVYENVMAGVKFAGINSYEAEKRVKDALFTFDLYDARDQRPKNLSGGQQQRTALAKALVKQSKLVLMDEPMSNVAEEDRQNYCKMLLQLKQMLPNSTFVYVTHSLKEALLVGDRIAFMQEGAIVGAVQKSMLKREVIPTDPSELLNTLRFANFFRLPCKLTPQQITVMDTTAPLGNLASRLISLPQNATAQFDVAKLSKTPLSNGIPLCFTVVENKGDNVILQADDVSFCLPKRTNLQAGWRIRMYYDINQILLFDGDNCVTSNYSLSGNLLPITVPSANSFTLFGKRYNVAGTIPQGSTKAFLPYTAITLATGAEQCVIPAVKCLQEDYFANFNIGYFQVAGIATYLSAKLSPLQTPLVTARPKLALDLSQLKFLP